MVSATKRTRVVFCWSGGKDSAMALHEMLDDPRYEVVALLTTLAKEFGRVSHHGVRESLLDAQAEAIGVRLDKMYLPVNASNACTNRVYETMMSKAMLTYLAEGVRTVAFGDIFLEDLRVYREKNLAEVGMSAVFPIWGRDTTQLVRRFVALGYRARLACVDGEKLDASFAGRAIDADLLRALPAGVDPCGENGEYHSFVWDGPMFRRPVPVRVGETIRRDTRWFTDLVLDDIAPGLPGVSVRGERD
ncbi:MAG: diphthine--ammonia ligase [Phycisphaera sp.]|nr:diphthine--ammonia ligase [Phycisphaera sp.]